MSHGSSSNVVCSDSLSSTSIHDPLHAAKDLLSTSHCASATLVDTNSSDTETEQQPPAPHRVPIARTSCHLYHASISFPHFPLLCWVFYIQVLLSRTLSHSADLSTKLQSSLSYMYSRVSCFLKCSQCSRSCLIFTFYNSCLQIKMHYHHNHIQQP